MFFLWEFKRNGKNRFKRKIAIKNSFLSLLFAKLEHNKYLLNIFIGISIIFLSFFVRI